MGVPKTVRPRVDVHDGVQTGRWLEPRMRLRRIMVPLVLWLGRATPVHPENYLHTRQHVCDRNPRLQRRGEPDGAGVDDDPIVDDVAREILIG